MRKLVLLAVPVLLLLGACSGGDDDNAAAPGTDAGTEQDGDLLIDAGAGDSGAIVDAAPTDAGFQPQLDAGPASGRFKAVSKDKTDAPNGFYEYLPGGYDGSLAAPLLVFWHGVGEDGNGLAEPDGGGDLHTVPNNGPPKLIKADKWPNARPFIVLSPQHTGAGTCPTNDEIDAFITWALGHYTVDDKRIYLTGLSCGAIGSWSYLTKYKGKVVASALLISGNPGNAWKADGCSLVADLSLWSVHGTNDSQVPFAPDDDEMTHLLACPSPKGDVKWSPIDGGTHDVWSKTYDLSYGLGDVYQWMLDHPKK